MEYLYHYTNIDSLALILSNKTIRLNPLDKMDDLQEKETQDKAACARFCFVSSWTSNAEESIPMWNLYTNMISGVRIKLRKYPFKWYKFTENDCKKIHFKSNTGVVEKSIIPVDDFINNKFFCYSYFFKEEFLHKVEYTNDRNLLYPLIKTNYNRYDIEKIGAYKNKYWEFQDEWRYKLNLYPIDYKKKDINPITIINRCINGEKEPRLKYYDLKIDEESFNNMEITLSPKMSIGNKLLVESAIEKYNSNVKCRESELFGLI